jgi:mannose/cellobiose epimerase-like protein (N-acyl-D-glucosamine 2-epimerase family)
MKKIIFAATLMVASTAQAAPETAPNCTLRELELAHRMFDNEHDANTQRVRLAQSEAMRSRPDLVDEIYRVGQPDPMILAPTLAQAAAEDRKRYLETCDVLRLAEAIQVSRITTQNEEMRLSKLLQESRRNEQ